MNSKYRQQNKTSLDAEVPMAKQPVSAKFFSIFVSIIKIQHLLLNHKKSVLVNFKLEPFQIEH